MTFALQSPIMKKTSFLGVFAMAKTKFRKKNTHNSDRQYRDYLKKLDPNSVDMFR